MSETRGAARIMTSVDTAHLSYRRFATGKVKLKVKDDEGNAVTYSFANAQACWDGKDRWEADEIGADEFALMEAVLEVEGGEDEEV